MLKIGGSLPKWAQLSAWFAVGVALIALKHLVPVGEYAWMPTLLEVIKDVGIAVVVAAFLAFTIERWFSADLHQDVFEAVLGYIPPAEFKDEIRSLLRYSFVCRKHVMRVAVEPLEGDCVRVCTTIERTLENITSRTASTTAHLHMDEWGFDAEPTKIIECYALLADGKRVNAPPPVVSDDSTIKTSSDNILVSPKKTLRFFQKCSEIRRLNDEVSFHFGAPTVNPEIHVSAPDHIEYMVSFGPSDPKIERDTYGERHTLLGAYFPGQRMRVRWWPKPASGPPNAKPAI